MGRACERCGKRTRVGRQYTRRGLAKRDGGVGRKVTGRTKRTFKPNLQQIRTIVGNSVVRLRICTQCLRVGKFLKPAPRRGHKAEA